MAGPSRDPDLVDGRYVAITPEIEAAAETIRRTFLDARQSYCPDAPAHGGKHSDYLKAAMLCIRLGEDPTAFALRQTREMAKRSVLYPKLLCSESFSQRSEVDEDVAEIYAIAGYHAQLGLFAGLRATFTPVQIIRDPVNQFTPLFRVCFAMRLGLDDVVELYRTQACLELAATPVAARLFPDEVARL